MVYALILIFFLLVFIGVPVAFSLGTTGFIFFIIEGMPLSVVAQRLFSTTQSFSFLAVPFFILAGNLMIKSGIAKKVINISLEIVGKLPGGLGLVSIITSMIMAGVSGSSVADASAVGSVLIPAMKEQGYSSSFSASINATSSVVGIIIPPSSTMIIIAWITELSVAKMFMAGVIPGFLFGLIYFIITIFISNKRDYPKGKKFDFKRTLISIREGIWAILLPLFILGPIILGIATATEVSSIAVVLSIFIGAFIYKELGFKGFWITLKDSVYATSVIMIILTSASIFSWMIIYEGVPDTITNILLGFGLGYNGLLLVLILVLIIAGTVLQLVPNLFVTLPIVYPIMLDIGMDPIHSAILILCSLALGLFTPPIGSTLFISCHLAQVNVEDTVFDLVPYFVGGLIVVLIIAFFPQISVGFADMII